MTVPEDKRIKALNQVSLMIHKRKAMVLELQSLAGLLNFINRAVIPGRAFTRRMYSKFSKILGKDKGGDTTDTTQSNKAESGPEDEGEIYGHPQ